MSDRIVMLLSNGLASDPRVEKEAAALVGAGYEVRVLAWDRGGELPRVEERSGFGIERLGPLARHGGGARNLPLYRRFWREAARRAVELNPAAVHCHDLDTAPAGLAVLRSAASAPPKLVLDFHELYRDSNMVPQRGLVGRVARVGVRSVERRAIPAADAILVANPGTVDSYDGLGAEGKITVVENAPDSDLFQPQVGPRPDRPFTVGFMGQKRYIGGLASLIEVVKRHEDVAALLAGGGTAAVEVAKRAADVPRVEVSGAFTYSQLPALYARCDAIHAVYDAVLGNVRTLFPVKVMEAMACALPVIVARGTWAGNYVEEHGIGLVVGPDEESLEVAIMQLKDDPEASAAMGQRGRELVDGGLNWKAASGRLLGVYERLRRDA